MTQVASVQPAVADKEVQIQLGKPRKELALTQAAVEELHQTYSKQKDVLHKVQSENEKLRAQVSTLQERVQRSADLDASVFGGELTTQLGLIIEHEATIAQLTQHVNDLQNQLAETASGQSTPVYTTLKDQLSELQETLITTQQTHSAELEAMRTRHRQTLQLSRSQLKDEINILRQTLRARDTRQPTKPVTRVASVQTELIFQQTDDAERLQSQEEAEKWRQQYEYNLAETSLQLDQLRQERQVLQKNGAQVAAKAEQLAESCALVRASVSKWLNSETAVTKEQLAELALLLSEKTVRDRHRRGSSPPLMIAQDQTGPEFPKHFLTKRASSGLGDITWNLAQIGHCRDNSPSWDEVVELMEDESVRRRMRQDSMMSISSMQLNRRPSLDSVHWDAHGEVRNTGTPLWEMWETIEEDCTDLGPGARRSSLRRSVKCLSQRRAPFDSQRGSQRSSQRGSQRALGNKALRERGSTGSIHGLKKLNAAAIAAVAAAKVDLPEVDVNSPAAEQIFEAVATEKVEIPPVPRNSSTVNFVDSHAVPPASTCLMRPEARTRVNSVPSRHVTGTTARQFSSEDNIVAQQGVTLGIALGRRATLATSTVKQLPVQLPGRTVADYDRGTTASEAQSSNVVANCKTIRATSSGNFRKKLLCGTSAQPVTNV